LVETRTSGVPQPAPHELRRERLLEVLHRHRSRPLILLVAPAGFGKSTLAATYARDSGGAVAWLSLQSGDRDTRRLFARLADALDAAFEEADSLPELRRGLTDGAEGLGLARLLLDDLAQTPAGFIIVLDDFHVVDESEDVTSAIDALIRELPESGQIVITAREAPDLSMTRLVVEGALFPLGIDDLRFSPEETRELRMKLRSSQGDEPDPEREKAEDERDRRAEGWVAGILLGGAPRQLNIGSGTLLGSYVESEVLTRLSQTEQHWLEMLSVFDTITVQAAERTFGPGNWSAQLLALTERCPFFVAGQNGTYRLHGLVRETVLNRLRRSPDDRATLAWTVAREIATEADDAVAVVRACQELGQIDGAVEIVQRVASQDVSKGRWSLVLVTLELLPEVVRRAHPDISLMEARACINTGQPARAQAAAEAALQWGGRTGDAQIQVRALIELATVAFASDMAAAEDWLSAAEHILHNNNFPQDVSRMLEGRVLAVRGICATERGNIVEARAAFENGERLLSLLGPSRELALIQQNLGNFCVRTGDYARAEEALGDAAAHLRVVGDRNGLATAQTILGDLHIRLAKPDEAGPELNDALEAARSVGAQRMEAFAVVALGQLHRVSGRLQQAIDAFDDGMALAAEVGQRELLTEVLVYRAEVALLCEDLPSARQLLARAQDEGQRLGSNAIMAEVDRALGRLHLVEGAGSRAVSHLEAALERAGTGWGADQRAPTLYWLGTAHLSLGWAQKASSYLEQAIELLEECRLPALLAGPAAEDGRLLQHGRQVGLKPVVLAEIERLASTRRPWTGVGPQAPVVIVHNDLPRIEAQLFGSFVLYRDGELITNAARKIDRIGELAAILILHPKGLPDDAIAELMFPDMKHERALHNLQMAASSLRKQLGARVAVRYSAKTYQLSPQIELVADVREFDAALNRARGATGESYTQALLRARELYRGELLPDAAWSWIESVRLEYRSRYVAALVQLADTVSPIDPTQSDAFAEEALGAAPETELAYERLMQNAQNRRDHQSMRRIFKRYQQAAAQYGFPVNPYLGEDGFGGRAAR
jgi:ATP/maltotriose-dependent transcriptional regulator MalT/DNA-binding SARP family transcriptional activator